MEELDELRKIAEQATPGNWMWVNDRTPELIRAGKYPYTHVTYTDDVADGDSLFIATFDPPTVLALITRLEQAEQAVERVREVAAGWATNDRPFREALIRALDGDGRG